MRDIQFHPTGGQTLQFLHGSRCPGYVRGSDLDNEAFPRQFDGKPVGEITTCYTWGTCEAFFHSNFVVLASRQMRVSGGVRA